MSGFVVSAAFKLVDQFSSVADHVGNKASQLGSKLSKLAHKAHAMRNLLGMAIGGLLLGKGMHHLFEEAAIEEQLEEKFKFAFERARKRIQIEAPTLHKEMRDMMNRSGVLLPEIQGAIVTPLLGATRLMGRNLLRTMNAVLDAGRFNGAKTAEEFEGISRAMAMAMQAPASAARALRQVQIKLTEEEQKRLSTMVKGKDILGAQAMVLDLIEAKVKGYASKDTIGKTMMIMKNQSEELGAAMGKVLYMFFGPGINATFKVFSKLNLEIGELLEKYQEGGKIDLAGMFIRAVEAFKSATSDAFNEIGSQLRKIYNYVAPALEPVGKMVTDLFSSAVSQGIVLGIKYAIPMILSALGDGFALAYEQIKSSMSGVLNTVSGGLLGKDSVTAFKEAHPDGKSTGILDGWAESTANALSHVFGIGDNKPKEGQVNVGIDVRAAPGTEVIGKSVNTSSNGLKVGATMGGRLDNNSYGY